VNRFVVVDVETANPDFASICQIGVVSFMGGQVVNTWKTLVDPEDVFFIANVKVHGITPEMVKGTPTFRQIDAQVRKFKKSSKQRKAEKLIGEGQALRIVTEPDFMQLVAG